MRRLTVFLVAAAGLMASASAQPRASLPESLHDFGAFSEDVGPVECDIPVVNTGDEPLRITNARATCGCTRPTFDPSPVAPGDTTWVRVVYDPSGRPGRFTKKVYIYTNTVPDKSAVVIKGVVIGSTATVGARFPVEAGPMQLRSSNATFGEVYRGKYKTLFFEAYNRSTDTIRPYWSGVPGYISVGAVPEAVPPGEQVTFTMLLDSSAAPEWGINTAVMNLYPDSGAAPVEISAVCIINEDFSSMTASQRERAPKIRVDNPKVDLGVLAHSQSPLKVRFVIANDGRSPLLVRRTLCVDPAVKELKLSASRIKPGKSATLTLTIDPSAIRSDILNTRVSLISNDPSEPTVPLRVVATVTD